MRKVSYRKLDMAPYLGGGELVISMRDSVSSYFMPETLSLTGSLNIVADIPPLEGREIELCFNALEISPNESVTAFGYDLTRWYAVFNSPYVFQFKFVSGRWRCVVMPFEFII